MRKGVNPIVDKTVVPWICSCSNSAREIDNHSSISAIIIQFSESREISFHWWFLKWIYCSSSIWLSEDQEWIRHPFDRAISTEVSVLSLSKIVIMALEMRFDNDQLYDQLMSPHCNIINKYVLVCSYLFLSSIF